MCKMQIAFRFFYFCTEVVRNIVDLVQLQLPDFGCMSLHAVHLETVPFCETAEAYSEMDSIRFEVLHKCLSERDPSPH